MALFVWPSIDFGDITARNIQHDLSEIESLFIWGELPEDASQDGVGLGQDQVGSSTSLIYFTGGATNDAFIDDVNPLDQPSPVDPSNPSNGYRPTTGMDFSQAIASNGSAPTVGTNNVDAEDPPDSDAIITDPKTGHQYVVSVSDAGVVGAYPYNEADNTNYVFPDDPLTGRPPQTANPPTAASGITGSLGSSSPVASDSTFTTAQADELARESLPSRFVDPTPAPLSYDAWLTPEPSDSQVPSTPSQTQQPSQGQPTSVQFPSSPAAAFNPMADSPLASLLLYGKDTPILDFLTNDSNLKTAQNVALGITLVAGTIATGGLLIDAAPAIGAGVSSAVSSINSFFAAAAAGAQSMSMAMVGAGTGAAGILAANPGLVDEADQEADTLGPELGNSLQSTGGALKEFTEKEWAELMRRDGYEFHHVFPTDLEQWFEEIGIKDVNQWTYPLKQAVHGGVHAFDQGNYNEEFENWLTQTAIPGKLGPIDAANWVMKWFADHDIPFDPAKLVPWPG